MNQGMGIPPIVIWSIGIPLLLADAATSQYWQDVARGVIGGKAQAASKTQAPYSGLWHTAGGVLLLILLATLADFSESGGVVAVTFLLALWLLFLLAHGSQVAGFLNLFNR